MLNKEFLDNITLTAVASVHLKKSYYTFDSKGHHLVVQVTTPQNTKKQLLSCAGNNSPNHKEVSKPESLEESTNHHSHHICHKDTGNLRK